MSPNSIRIRSAVNGDAQGIRELMEQLGYPDDVEAVNRRLRQLLSLDHHAVFVAEYETHQLIGMCHVFQRPLLLVQGMYEIGALVVDANYWRRGIGRLLIDAGAQWARDQGGLVLTVRSNANRQEARMFYPAYGFSVKKIQNIFQMELVALK